ncbi:hypothetical protein DB347_22870 [Opitutaceae bacterium EW11]|nr:hypothetical protein DB347_22870 [Opitutaceae bacterium EW11]
MLALSSLWVAEFGAALMPHGQCFLWDGGLISLHAISDGLIALAYYVIAGTLLYILRRRRDMPFSTIVLLFGAFIIACGTSHLMETITIWQPYYWLSGWVKAVTAVVSSIAVVALFKAIPSALQLPSPDQLQEINVILEQRVKERTADLSASNERLAREVQQREQAEAEVRRLNRSLELRLHEQQALFDLLPVGIAIARDAECREIQANQRFADLLGIQMGTNASLSAAPMRVQPFRVFQNGRELQQDELPMQRAARENRAVLNFEETLLRRDGTQVHVVLNAVPLRDAEGNAHGCVATVQDITAQTVATEDRLAFERRLQETQKLESLGVLAGGIAHDFNNLLTGILGNASIARLELPSGHAPVRAALDNLEHAAMRAADLCKQMLAYAGKGRFVIQPLSLSGLIKNTAELLEVSISKKATLQLNLAEGLPAVQGDATQIRQVLMNLVINASEAIGDRSGAILVRTSLVQANREYLETKAFREQVEEGSYVCLEVSDTGSGMDRETLARVFDPFFTTKFTGRGLGLAAVLGIVRGHKGAIRVTSQPGKGTEFEILFPALGQLATPPDPLIHAGAEGARSSMPVMVVDDEEAVRAVAVRVLRNSGFRVVPAENGVKALEILRADTEKFALVLLDLTMPRMDGEEAFRLIREIKPDVPVVIMSGFSEQDMADRFSGLRLDGFVEKPFSAETLLTKVRAVLGRQVPA